MNLGSIAHLQYYFARTGILDGKGGQMAKEGRKLSGVPKIYMDSPSDDADSLFSSQIGGDLMASPTNDGFFAPEWDEPLMLPPTVSTYSHRTQYIPPPPDSKTLVEDLRKALVDVDNALREAQSHPRTYNDRQENDGSVSIQTDSDDQSGENQSVRSSSEKGWHELQGMHMLDVVTLAIRAAKVYYTMHEHPQRLATIKPERQVREELLGVLDVLKRMANRQFAGGMKGEELQVVEDWVRNVRHLLATERAIEEQEKKDRENWRWLEGEWEIADRERERLFMNTFIADGDLPQWSPPLNGDPLPTAFLEKLRSGLTLVVLHNTILKKTKRHLGEIKVYHTDTAKPYRAAENLRYWIKAAEIRWEIKLQVDVMGVVYGTSDAAWKGFDAAILAWCQAVREEITKEWKQGSVQVPISPPEILP